MMITVACVWVQANVPFTLEYVARLRDMVARRLTLPHRFVCLTDRAHAVSSIGVEAIRVPTPTTSGWWSKLELFNPSRGLRDRVMYLDLDVLVVSSLDPIAQHESEFALAPPGGHWRGRDGLGVVTRYNSSVMVWNAGSLGDRLSSLHRCGDAPQRLWGDQDWIGEQCPDADTMPSGWFPRLSELRHDWSPPWRPDARVVLCKKPKNHEAVGMYPWFDEAWR